MIGIVLIGCGAAAPEYGDAARRVPEARLAGIVECDANLARRTAQALDVSTWATDFDDLLRHNSDMFDAVAVGRGCGSPQPVVEQAVQAGKHVLLDMSLLVQVRPDTLLQKARPFADVTLMLGQGKRFVPSVAEVKRSLNSEVLGAPGLLRIHDWRPPNSDNNKSLFLEGSDHSSTIFQAVLPDIDLAIWLFETLPTEVFAIGVNDYIQVHLGYPSGGMALVDCAKTLPSGADYFSLSVFGADGAAYADDHHNMHLLYCGGPPTALPVGQGILSRVAELQEFVGAVKAVRPPAITIEEVYRAAEVVDAARQSLESGRAMRLMGSQYEFI